MAPDGSIVAALAAVRREIDAAARRVGRDPGSIRIVAVTKTFPATVVSAALAAGLTDIGENYVQEGVKKRADVGGVGTWHLIGGLQRNKVRAAVASFDVVHTVDSARLAAALASETERAGRRLPVLLQIAVGGETTKRGVPPEGLHALAEKVLGYPALALQGLMTIPPAPEKPESSRRHFRLVAEVRDRTQNRLGVELPHLSMGMSDDFTVAVEEGATLLRLGRALFGARGLGASRPGSSVGGDGS
ncbi:MAG TPA: YggS family pyridoxal phosphate-dependent enzyme [Candidatus Binatia bacterium]|nr:YggS family pyridoxal phosphate-dependent enzyme [Candidatus Binatia bacterium]